ncbi:LLM class flavin-dependent oxidoreductase [Dactylosporangium sp. NPDC005572]|uniref:LLM class flavin-dependent oxidoreductase n=1 Tax=Dactylosporangium sp. NPDC005572 TaxID=3156889 RepID=UPI0033B0DEEC
MSIEFAVTSLADLQPRTVDGAHRTAEGRLRQITGLAVLTDRLGLDVFALGEHHSTDFAVSSPAVVLAAAAARTTRVRLASAVTVLSALDPVRVYEDFATLDVLSGGRAELTVGRSAYPDPFALFGVPVEQYGEVFAEHLDLLLRIRAGSPVTWRGRFRAPLSGAAVVPRAVQEPLPVWVGVGGTPASAERAGRLGLPMTLGYLGGPADGLRRLADIYREAAGPGGRLGVAVHLFAAADEAAARATYPYYRDFLRPKRPGAPGYVVSPEQFATNEALMIGTSAHVAEKLAALREVLRYDRIQALVDWGGLPERLVEESVHRLAEEIAPALR